MFRALLNLRSALSSRDFAGIIEAAKKLADLVGLGNECSELIGLVTACQNGNYSAALEQAALFLHDVAKYIQGFKTSVMAPHADNCLAFLESAEKGNVDEHWLTANNRSKILDPFTMNLIIQASLQLSQWIIERIAARRNAGN